MHRVLIVDDSNMVRKVLKKSFLAIDMPPENIFEAADGNEAIEQMMLAEDTLSLIITDINMPGMNGIDFVKMVRKNPDYASCHVIVLSSIINDETIKDFEGFRVDDFLKKPFNQQSFENIIVPALEGGEITKDIEKYFDESLEKIDTKQNRIVFEPELLKKCQERSGGKIKLEDTIQTILTKKLRLSSKDRVTITEKMNIVVEKFVDRDKLKRETVKKIQSAVLKDLDETTLIKRLLGKTLGNTIDFTAIEIEDFITNRKKLINKPLEDSLAKNYATKPADSQMYIEYLLEKYTSVVYSTFAGNIAMWLGKGNQNVLKFINAYSGGVKHIGEGKYQMPSIKTKKGEFIATNKVQNISKIYLEATESLDKSKKESLSIKEDIKTMEVQQTPEDGMEKQKYMEELNILKRKVQIEANRTKKLTEQFEKYENQHKIIVNAIAEAIVHESAKVG